MKDYQMLRENYLFINKYEDYFSGSYKNIQDPIDEIYNEIEIIESRINYLNCKKQGIKKGFIYDQIELFEINYVIQTLKEKILLKKEELSHLSKKLENPYYVLVNAINSVLFGVNVQKKHFPANHLMIDDLESYLHLLFEQKKKFLDELKNTIVELQFLVKNLEDLILPSQKPINFQFLLVIPIEYAFRHFFDLITTLKKELNVFNLQFIFKHLIFLKNEKQSILSYT